LLHPARGVAFRRDIEQQDPGIAAVDMEMQVGGDAASQFHRRDEIRRLKQWNQAFEEERLLHRRLARAQLRQPIAFELAARRGQGHFGVDL